VIAGAKKRRIVPMTQLPDQGYGFSVKTCYEWCALRVDPMPFIDMSKPGAKHKRYFVDLDALDAWLARREQNTVQTSAPTTTPATAVRSRASRRAECEALGIEPEHAFA
jgi:hypothetical protein